MEAQKQNNMKPKVHELKIHPHFFIAVKNDSKPFEVRNNDRDFKVGDEILLKEFINQTNIRFNQRDREMLGYTGRTLRRKISYILDRGQCSGIEDHHVVLGLQKLKESTKKKP